MRKQITLKKDYEIKLQSKITPHHTPKYVYLPITEELLITEPQVLKEEEIMGQMISPISGEIIGTKHKQLADGSIVNCFVIKNDFKEKLHHHKASMKDLRKVSKEKILIDLKQSHFSKLLNQLINAEDCSTLILNGVEDEPYVANEIFMMKENMAEILSMLDVLKEKFSFGQVKIVLKNNDRDNIEKLEDSIGTYPDVELALVPDVYLIGEEAFLKEYLKQPHSLILKPSEIMSIYQLVKRHRLITETIFTISGDAIKNPQVIEAKIGSSIKEILESHIKIPQKVELEYYVNGLMRGIQMEPDNLIVTSKLKSLLIMKKTPKSEQECINCGKCLTVCPANCNPKLAYEKKSQKYAQSCIDCGLCSYICPSYINLRKYVKGDIHE